SFVSGAMAKAGKGLLEGTLQAGTSAVSDKLLDLVGLGGKSAVTLSNLKLLRRITRTENILHRNFTRRQVAIQNRVASNIGISQSTFSVKVLNLFSRSRRKTNKRKSKHSAMLRNKETRH